MGTAGVAISAAAALSMLLLVLASTAASEDVPTRPQVPPDFPLVQLQQQDLGRGDDGSSSSAAYYSVINRFRSSLAQAAAFADGTVAAAIAILLPLTTKSTPAAVAASTCSYTVTIKTSCYSPRVTHDIVALYFGDAYGNQVYAARLDDPRGGTFESCSTDTFLITGPCGYKTCYLYLSRSGRDGWAPDWVRVVSPYTRQAVTFYYNGYALPANVWYGFNLCGYSSGAGGRADAAGHASWMVLVVAVLLLLVLRPPPFFFSG